MLKILMVCGAGFTKAAGVSITEDLPFPNQQSVFLEQCKQGKVDRRSSNVAEL